MRYQLRTARNFSLKGGAGSLYLHGLSIIGDTDPNDYPASQIANFAPTGDMVDVSAATPQLPSWPVPPNWRSA
jgi:hypothetical protein